LVQWLANGPLDDPLIAQQGAALLLASLNGQPCNEGRRLPYAAFNAHIDQHVAQPLEVADLARIASLSVARLHARFVAECGQTPMDYLRGRRLQIAHSLLRDSPLAIGEIAERVGYGSQSAFAAAMLREFGASPGALRRKR
jgi:transcriptional regulator GlxA family with amidase domain